MTETRHGGTLHRFSAFGLTIESDLSLPGSHSETLAGTSSLPVTRVRRASAEELDRVWSQPSRRVLEPPENHDGPDYTIDLGETDFLFWLEGRGRYLVSLDGATVLYEVGADDPVRRERYLFAQSLPVAALMRGYEVLHASAVRAGSHGAAALTGMSGSGKTTLAGHLIARGADFVSDDVVAVRARSSALLVYPGPGFMAMREADFRAMPAVWALGETTGISDKVHVSPEADPNPSELRVMYHLEIGDEFEIVAVERSELGRSLGTAFASYVMTPGRLRRHLEISQRISSEVAQFRVLSPRTGVTEAMIDALEAHVAQACG